MKPSAEELKLRFQAVFGQHVIVNDDSHLHVGHAGAGGGGHYSVEIISEKFLGLRTLQRHRLVYDVVSEMMPHEIHALSINAKVPE
ncbi:MAG: BolA family transcriptional regulator [Burkholderiales bacterium]|jgi:BolA protein|nr:BolA family transcriptional regulator [Burkholderiales bacterium]